MADRRTPTAAPAAPSPPPSVWLRFTGYSAPHFDHSNVVLEFCRAARREFSPLVRAVAPFQFSAPIDCRLPCHGPHSFVLYTLQPRQVTITNGATALFRFSIDTHAVCQRLLSGAPQPLALSVSSPAGLQLSYEASLDPPLYTSTEEATVLSALDDDASPLATAPPAPRSLRPLDLSFSSVSEDGDSAEDSPRASDSFPSKRAKRHSKVRFSDTLQIIPSTQQLKEDVDLATAERARLSRDFGDLAAQLSQLQNELRDVKQSVKTINHPAAQSDALRAAGDLLRPHAAPTKRRRVVLDGHSVACSYGKGKFRPQGISAALQYYHTRGFNAVAVVSKRALEHGNSSRERSQDALLAQLVDSGLVAVTTSRSRREEFMLRYALDHNAYVVSNECLQSRPNPTRSAREQRRLQSFLDSHRIPFMFIANEFVPTSPSLRHSRSSDCLRTHCRRDSF